MKQAKRVKIIPLSVRIKDQKQKHHRLINHAKKGRKEGYNGKWHVEISNGDDPFNNVE